MLSQQQGPTSFGSIPLTASSREELRQGLEPDTSPLSTDAAAGEQETVGKGSSRLIKEDEEGEEREEEEEEDKGKFSNLGLGGGKSRDMEGASGIGAFL